MSNSNVLTYKIKELNLELISPHTKNFHDRESSGTKLVNYCQSNN